MLYLATQALAFSAPLSAVSRSAARASSVDMSVALIYATTTGA